MTNYFLREKDERKSYHQKNGSFKRIFKNLEKDEEKARDLVKWKSKIKVVKNNNAD
jgi:hypothetical protein